jgi:ketosteroid isomerase-like protein
VSAHNDVLAAAAAIVDDFGHHRTGAYFSGFSEDATYIFYTHTDILRSRAEYESLWASWEENDGFRVHGCTSTNGAVTLITDTSAVFTHLVESTVEFAGEVSTIHERETIVFALRDGRWLAVHEHLSPAGD